MKEMSGTELNKIIKNAKSVLRSQGLSDSDRRELAEIIDLAGRHMIAYEEANRKLKRYVLNYGEQDSINESRYIDRDPYS